MVLKAYGFILHRCWTKADAVGIPGSASNASIISFVRLLFSMPTIVLITVSNGNLRFPVKNFPESKEKTLARSETELISNNNRFLNV